jgi:hypothetical protein
MNTLTLKYMYVIVCAYVLRVLCHIRMEMAVETRVREDLSGPDAPYLLRGLWHLVDGRPEDALEFLEHPIALQNASLSKFNDEDSVKDGNGSLLKGRANRANKNDKKNKNELTLELLRRAYTCIQEGVEAEDGRKLCYVK